MDGTVRCWGSNFLGQLGDGTTTSRLHPVVVAGLTDAAQLALGTNYSCARLSDRTVRCWGANFMGQLGDGTTFNRATPAPVPGLTGVEQIAASLEHVCARLSDRTMRCWGSRAKWQLGDETLTGRCGLDGCSTTPVVVPGVADVVDMALGAGTTFALMADGSLRGWGANNNDQLWSSAAGDFGYMPVVVGAVTAAGIAAGIDFACAFRSDGSVSCWGWNAHATLGDPSITGVGRSVMVPGLSSVVQLSAQQSSSCARRADGSVACWGYDVQGQAGDGPGADTCNLLGDFACRRSPTAVSGLSRAVGLSVGGDHACARVESGAVLCWGRNDAGELGDGTTIGRDAPVPVVW